MEHFRNERSRHYLYNHLDKSTFGPFNVVVVSSSLTRPTIQIQGVTELAFFGCVTFCVTLVFPPRESAVIRSIVSGLISESFSTASINS